MDSGSESAEPASSASTARSAAADSDDQAASTTMGSVLARNGVGATAGSSAPPGSDAVPSSSSDSTSEATQQQQTYGSMCKVEDPDPISSTSEDPVLATNQPEVATSSPQRESESVTGVPQCAPSHDMKNVDDIANELEDLLEASADEYTMSSNVSRHASTSPLGDNWDLDSELSSFDTAKNADTNGGGEVSTSVEEAHVDLDKVCAPSSSKLDTSDDVGNYACEGVQDGKVSISNVEAVVAENVTNDCEVASPADLDQRCGEDNVVDECIAIAPENVGDAGICDSNVEGTDAVDPPVIEQITATSINVVDVIANDVGDDSDIIQQVESVVTEVAVEQVVYLPYVESHVTNIEPITHGDVGCNDSADDKDTQEDGNEDSKAVETEKDLEELPPNQDNIIIEETNMKSFSEPEVVLSQDTLLINDIDFVLDKDELEILPCKDNLTINNVNINSLSESDTLQEILPSPESLPFEEENTSQNATSDKDAEQDILSSVDNLTTENAYEPAADVELREKEDSPLNQNQEEYADQGINIVTENDCGSSEESAEILDTNKALEGHEVLIENTTDMIVEEGFSGSNDVLFAINNDDVVDSNDDNSNDNPITCSDLQGNNNSTPTLDDEVTIPSGDIEKMVTDEISAAEQVMQQPELFPEVMDIDEPYDQEESYQPVVEDDNLENALIQAALDAEHTRREIKEREIKEQEAEAIRLREEAENARKEKERKREQYQNEIDRLMDVIKQRELEEQANQKKKEEEKRKSIEEELRIKKEEIRLKEEEIRQKEEDRTRELAEKKKKDDLEKQQLELKARREKDEQEESERRTKALEELLSSDNIVQSSQKAKNLDETTTVQMDQLQIKINTEPVTKDEVTEQPSESEDDNRPEYSSKMSTQDLKMTITKNKTDESDTILKIYDPKDADNIKKLKIKPVIEPSVDDTVPKISLKALPHSPKRTLRNLSPNRPQSPKVLIKPVVKPHIEPPALSPLKITISKTEATPQHNSPITLTIKPLLKPNDDADDAKSHSPMTYRVSDDTDRSNSPKAAIKSKLLETKRLKKEGTPTMVEPLKIKLNRESSPIQQGTICNNSNSPKITIKPVVRPAEMPVDEESSGRIVLKINRNNYQSVDSNTPSTSQRKREAPEDIEKLAKIKLKMSKKDGHAHIINSLQHSNEVDIEAMKRFLPEGVELFETTKRTKILDEVRMPINTPHGLSITPIVHPQIANLRSPESDPALEELSSDSVIFVSSEVDMSPSPARESLPPSRNESPAFSSTVAPLQPRKRGRPRKHPIQVQELPVDEPTILLAGTTIDITNTGSDSVPQSPEDGEHSEAGGSGRPKRSCRGPSAQTQLGIKPRKPRGGRGGRGGTGVGRGRGRGRRGGLRGGGVEKFSKFGRISDAKLRLYKNAALGGMHFEDSFERQHIAIKIIDNNREQSSLGVRRLDDDDASNSRPVDLMPRFMPERELAEEVRCRPPPGKGRIGLVANTVIDITDDSSQEARNVSEEEEDDIEHRDQTELSMDPLALPCMQGGSVDEDVMKITSTSTVPHPTRQLKIVISKGDQVFVEDGQDISMYEEETRMSADSNSQGQTVIKTEPIIEESQSSIQSTATSESVKVQRKVYRDLLPENAETRIVTPDQLAEYNWTGEGPFMLQEQVAEYLGIKSFKRKYPGIQRRAVDMHERDYILERGLASEAMCNLGLTVLYSADVLDIMYADFHAKYEEYCKYRRDRETKEIMNRQRALNLAANQEKTKQDLLEQAIASTAKWNAQFNRKRRDERPACVDLQTYTINYPKGTRPIIDRGRTANYPLALVPGQFTDYYHTYTPTELNNMPFNTLLYKKVPGSDDEDDDSDGSSSDSGSDSGSSSSGSNSSSSDEASDSEVVLSPATITSSSFVGRTIAGQKTPPTTIAQKSNNITAIVNSVAKNEVAA